MKEINIHDLKSGESNAFKDLYHCYFNALCSFGYTYLSDRYATEDLVQEAFISYFESKENFDTLNTIKAFLYTSVRNKCLNRLKHLSVIEKNQDKLIYELESEHFFKANIIKEETFNQLYSEISELPEASQKIMLLVLNGLKNREIADHLSISENTVKTQKKIAYAKLKKKLKPNLYSILLSF